MIWNISFILICLILILSLSLAVFLSVKQKNNRFLSPFRVVFAGVFLAILIGLMPVKNSDMDYASNAALNSTESFIISIINSVQIFKMDIDHIKLLDAICLSGSPFKTPYLFIMLLLFMISPFLTVGVILSFFVNVSAYGKYLTGFFKETYIFSDLNDRSIILACDIRKNHPESLVIFTGINDTSSDLAFEARKNGAVIYKKDINTINFMRHSSKSNISFFVISGNDTNDINCTLNLIDKYKKRKNTHLYLFSSSCESELAVSGLDKGEIRVRRISEERSNINRLFYEEGTRLFEKAKADNPDTDGKIPINTIVVGMGAHGTEMVKTLAWYGQMEGFHINIDAFDIRNDALDRFAFLCPELISEERNGVCEKGECEYNINIHSGIDACTKTFADILRKTGRATYVFIALNSDEESIKAAVNIRMLFRRFGCDPIIQALVRNPKASEILKSAVNFKGQPYGIEFIGDFRTSYSEDVIINSKLEEEALKRHLIWGEEEQFWNYEYNYRSSIASVIHRKAREFCRIPGMDKLNAGIEPDENEIELLQLIEHKRWNAYVRSEGYVYSGSRDKSSRDDLAKTHHDLVDYYVLSPADQRKDLW